MDHDARPRRQGWRATAWTVAGLLLASVAPGLPPLAAQTDDRPAVTVVARLDDPAAARVSASLPLDAGGARSVGVGLLAFAPIEPSSLRAAVDDGETTRPLRAPLEIRRPGDTPRDRLDLDLALPATGAGSRLQLDYVVSLDPDRPVRLPLPVTPLPAGTALDLEVRLPAGTHLASAFPSDLRLDSEDPTGVRYRAGVPTVPALVSFTTIASDSLLRPLWWIDGVTALALALLLVVGWRRFRRLAS